MEKAEFFAEFKKKQYLKLMYVWGHSYEFDNHDNWNVIEDFCAYMGGRNDIWYATNIEIIDYMDAARRLIFSADCRRVYNPNAISVWLEIDGDLIITFFIIMLLSLCRCSYKLFYQFINKKSKQSANRI